MRWTAAALALVAGALLLDIRQQSQVAAKLDGLAVEVAELRRARSVTAALDDRDRELLAEAVALRVAMTMAPAASSGTVPSTAAAPPPAPSVPQPVPTRAQLAALEAANRILEAALSNGTLRTEQVDEMRRLSLQADPAGFGELRRRIAMALNRDELRIADPAAGLP